MATLTDPMPVLMTPEQKSRIAAIAQREEVSMALVVRELIDKALPAREKKSLQRAGMLR